MFPPDSGIWLYNGQAIHTLQQANTGMWSAAGDDGRSRDEHYGCLMRCKAGSFFFHHTPLPPPLHRMHRSRSRPCQDRRTATTQPNWPWNIMALIVMWGASHGSVDRGSWPPQPPPHPAHAHTHHRTVCWMVAADGNSCPGPTLQRPYLGRTRGDLGDWESGASNWNQIKRSKSNQIPPLVDFFEILRFEVGEKN